LNTAGGESGGKLLTQVPQLVRSTKEEGTALIPLTGVQGERGRGKRHFSSEDKEL